jgi:hypothetical protein
VTNFSATAQSYRRENSRRVLSYLLLLLIAYGGTVATVHSHGHFTPTRTASARFVDVGGSDHHSHTGLSHEIECSMCRFQQNLFSGLVHEPRFAPTPSTQTAVVAALAVQPDSILVSPTSGRGPPFASLL